MNQNYDEPRPKASNTSQENDSKSFKCVGKCNSIQKSFNHQDELDLHMKFYHEANMPSQE